MRTLCSPEWPRIALAHALITLSEGKILRKETSKDIFCRLSSCNWYFQCFFFGPMCFSFSMFTKKFQSLKRKSAQRKMYYFHKTGKEENLLGNSNFVSFSLAVRLSCENFLWNNSVRNIKSNILSECINLMCSMLEWEDETQILTHKTNLLRFGEKHENTLVEALAEKYDYNSVEDGVGLSVFPIFAVNNTFSTFSDSKVMVMLKIGCFSAIHGSLHSHLHCEISLKYTRKSFDVLDTRSFKIV